jgi:hypothetical protein
MKSTCALLLCLLLPLSIFAAETQNGYKVTYDGGTLSNVKAGAGIEIVINSGTISFVKDKSELVSIPASAVTEISHGQDVHRRVGAAIGLAVISLGIGGLMALTKSKKHYVALTWADGNNKGGLAIQCDKNNYRGVLAALEGVTGKKAVNFDTMTVKN